MKRIKTYGMFICLTIFILTFFNVKAEAANGDAEKIRVGFYEIEGFQYYDEYGYKTGYNFDYLKFLSFMNNWEYEFVDVKDFPSGRKMLQDREIDLLAPCLKVVEDESRMLLSDTAVGTDYVTLLAKKDNDNYFYEDFDHFDGMKVGVVEHHPITRIFDEYVHEKGIHLQYACYDSYDDMMRALNKGFVDAAVSSQMKAGNEYKLLARVASAPVYFATWKGNDSFMKELNEAMKKVESTYPALKFELMKRHFPGYEQQFFTRDDWEYITRSGVIRLGYVPGRVPVSYTDSSGELAGISRSIFDRVSEISGLRFEYVELPQGAITYSYLNDQKIDLITGIEDNNFNRNNTSMVMSSPYFYGSEVMVGRDDAKVHSNAYKKLGITAGSQMLKSRLERQYPNFDIIVYDSVQDCFEAVRKGKIDFLIQDQYVVENWLAHPMYENLHTVPMEGYEDSLCFAVTTSLEDGKWVKTEDHIKLIRIIDKALSQITPEEQNLLMVHETMENKYTYTLWDFIYQYRVTLSVIGVFLLCGVFVAAYVNGLRKKNRMMAERERMNLKIQQRRFKLVLESAEEMFYEISIHEESCYSSEAIREKFGWEIPDKVDSISPETVGRILHIHPDDMNNFVGEESIRQEGIVRLQSADGTYCWCRVTQVPILDNRENVISIVGKIEDVDSETKEKAELKKQTRMDDLTGLLNKKTFMEDVKEFLSQHAAGNCGFIFLDMDHFKEVNDILGHAMGDVAIRDVAEKIQLIFSNCDMVSRFGGDEFCVFVKNIPLETLEDKLNFALKKLCGQYKDEEHTIEITASIGAAFCELDEIDFDTLFQCADNALYEAKDLGRNQYVINELVE